MTRNREDMMGRLEGKVAVVTGTGGVGMGRAVALRFARVLRYREDKPAAEADTIDMVRALSPA